MNHYKWLDKNFKVFLNNLEQGDLWKNNKSIILTHGDKCYGYEDRWKKKGIPFEHGVAIYLLSYIKPWTDYVRVTVDGWVDPCEWVEKNYTNFENFLPVSIMEEKEIADKIDIYKGDYGCKIAGNEVSFKELREDVLAAKKSGLSNSLAFCPETVEALLTSIESLISNKGKIMPSNQVQFMPKEQKIKKLNELLDTWDTKVIYTVTVMARRDLAKGFFKSAILRLRQEYDKMYSYKPLQKFINDCYESI